MKKWLLLAVVGLMSACSKSDIEEVNTSIGAESPTFYASLEGSDETRTYLDENAYMRWTADDRVTIFFGENYNREFAFTGKTGATSGGFKQVSTDDPFYTAVTMSANYALYPYATDVVLEPAGYLEFSLPATQSYAEDSFGLNANTMVAVTKTVDDRFLQFKNVCGYLKLNLYGANVTVKRITLTGNNEEPLAGAATVTPTYGGDPSMAWAASGTTTSLTLDCGDGVKIGATEAEATPFWLVVPPTTFTKGFTVTITDTAGNTFTKSSTSKQTITRNISKNMPAFEIAPIGPANNEIWYTSTDGKIVEPNSKDAFWVAIKSNTYENGKGVITFDGDVKTIGKSAFRKCISLTSITLPEGLTTIGEDAFYNCTSLASITLPEGVTTIGKYAFNRCSSLTSITLPEGLTTIESYTFEHCTSLASITLPESVTSIGERAFYGCTSLAKFEGPLATSDQRCIVIDGALVAFAPAELFEYVIPEGVTTIGKRAFYHCTSLASITLPEGVTSIGEYAFRDCTSLTSITLPEGLTTIGASAFGYCTNLKSIIIPEGLTTIGSSTFNGCTSLASITLPESITEIGQSAFYGCTSLASITLPEGLTTIGGSAFHSCTSLASITLPEGVTSIGEGAFHSCTSLAKFEGPLATSDQRCIVIDGALVAFAPAELFEYVIPEGVTTIGKRAFWNCSSLASITLPEGLTTIGENAFSGCTSLAKFEGPLATSDQRCIVIDGALVAFAPAELFEYVIPEGVTTIGKRAFYHCTSLASITLPEGVTSIGEYAFRDCTSLTSITLPEGLTTIGASAFGYCTNLKSIIIPEGLTTIGSSTFNGCTSLASITLPESITEIGQSAFYGCTSLASITLPEGLTTIGGSAFHSCTSLASITLPEGVTSIGEGAFHSCTSLAKFEGPLATSDQRCIVIDGALVAFAPAELFEYVIPEGVTTIGKRAFWNCSSLASITLPEGMTTIGEDAFFGCKRLASITLPEGVTEIGQAAFYQCASLASVYCKPITPPTGGVKMFHHNASGRKIYVPAGSVDAYKAAQYWSAYASAIVAEE